MYKGTSSLYRHAPSGEESTSGSVKTLWCTTWTFRLAHRSPPYRRSPPPLQSWAGVAPTRLGAATEGFGPRRGRGVSRNLSFCVLSRLVVLSSPGHHPSPTGRRSGLRGPHRPSRSPTWQGRSNPSPSPKPFPVRRGLGTREPSTVKSRDPWIRLVGDVG